LTAALEKARAAFGTLDLLINNAGVKTTALWREHEASLALHMYWSNALSSQVGRGKRELLIKFDPRDVSRIFVQHPNGHLIEAPHSLGFPAISLREWRKARKALE
jgi:NAD(P)-dependent dehydrogenase (short-subunit alcohol dehydrogenase family)